MCACVCLISVFLLQVVVVLLLANVIRLQIVVDVIGVIFHYCLALIVVVVAV